jgi:hypothetical protein
MQQNSEEPQNWKSLRYGYTQKTHNDRNSVVNSVTLRTDSHFTQHNSKCKSLKRSAKKYWQTLETICEDPLRPRSTDWHLLFLNVAYFTPRGKVIHEKRTGPPQLVKFPEFYGTRRFITTFARVHDLCLSWTRSIQSMLPSPIPLLKGTF